MPNLLNILIVSSDKYPDGGASANRHLAYAKGLVEIGNTVTFILLAPQKNKQERFQTDGITFINAYKSNLFSRIFKKHSSLVPLPSVPEGRRQIKQRIVEKKADIVVLLDTHLWLLKPMLDLCVKHKIKILHERTEFPSVVLKRGLLGKFHLYLYGKYFLQKLDAIFVITNALKQYFTDLVNNRVRVEVINMMVDPTRFQGALSEPEFDSGYLAYCGGMEIEKDGINILIRAFGKACQILSDSNNLKLVLIGPISSSSLADRLTQIIKESGCENRVILTGRVRRDAIPNLLSHAGALALARPDSLQAEGGFPTKLGEYLATKKPVIITNTGEIGLFLKDGENAFIAEPGSVESFASKIVCLFNDYPAALRIGMNGYGLTLHEFNYLQQSVNLNNIMHTVIKNT